ncbi:MAG: 5-deoxy-glucuronate isomerase [Solirubrobacterales bacterium]
MSSLHVRGARGCQRIVSVTPESAGWDHVGFEVLELRAPLELPELRDREACVVVVEGSCEVVVAGSCGCLLSRRDPFADLPDALFVPAGAALTLIPHDGAVEVAICTAPAAAGEASPRRIGPADVEVEIRGRGEFEREIRPILMGDDPGVQSLLVCEVLTPAGHWSSFPPHKHDRDDPPEETELEETYYHRVDPPEGFGLQRVYTDDRSLDESIAFADGDTILVPRGYHTVSAPPGCRLYYLNVMAGPVRSWAVSEDREIAAAVEAGGGVL